MQRSEDFLGSLSKAIVLHLKFGYNQICSRSVLSFLKRCCFYKMLVQIILIHLSLGFSRLDLTPSTELTELLGNQSAFQLNSMTNALPNISLKSVETPQRDS